MVGIQCKGVLHLDPPSIVETVSTTGGSYSAMDVSVPSDTRAAYDALAPVYDGLTAHHDHERWLALLLGSGARPRPRRQPRAGRGLRHREELHAARAPRLRRHRLRPLPRDGRARAPARPRSRRAGARGRHAPPPGALRGRRPGHLPRRRRQLPARPGRAARRPGRHARATCARAGCCVFDVNTLATYRAVFCDGLSWGDGDETYASVGEPRAVGAGRLFATTLQAWRGDTLLAREPPRAAPPPARGARARPRAPPGWSRSRCTAAPPTGRPSARRTSSCT